LFYPCPMCQGYTSAAVSISHFSGVYLSFCIHVWIVRGILQLLYTCLICPEYTSAAVSMPDVSGVYFSCCIHAWCIRGILQLLYPCLMCQRYFSQLLYPCFMCQGYSSAAVSMPDLWELFFSWCIHVLFFRGIPQLLHPCLIW
jgi:hypothetical protein